MKTPVDEHSRPRYEDQNEEHLLSEDNELDDGVELVHVLSSSLGDVSDNEISTKKEFQRRLGPVDLNDTLEFDFSKLDTPVKDSSNMETSQQH